ncbi:MAG: ABC transporter permease subunit [bacterium]|nr:ABC transporter permease subunit [bacterium]
MENIKHIFKKEFKTFFVTPIAYIVISLFLLIIGWLYFSTFFLNGQANMTQFFSLLPVILAFIIPAITMRLFSEEMNLGTYEILLTLPVTFRDIILGKFLAAVAFIGVMLSPTLVYAIFTSFLGDLDWGPVIGGYIGAMLLGAAFCAIGLLASSITKNQVIAFIIGMTICFGLTLLTDFLLFFLSDNLVDVFQYFSANFHFRNIAKGVVDSRDLLYFVSVCFIALHGANLIMQEKK